MMSSRLLKTASKHSLWTIIAVVAGWAIVTLSLEGNQLLDLSSRSGNGNSESMKLSSADILVLQTVRMRREIAKESFRMMMSDTEETSSSPTVDISPMIALMKEAITTLGIRKVHEDLLTIESFGGALLEAAKELGIRGFRTVSGRPSDDGQPFIHYTGIPNNRNYVGMTGSCHGHLWWLWHYMGSVVADLLLNAEQQIFLDVNQESILMSPLEYLEELRRLQRSDYPDPGQFHAQHGFVWHYLALKQPNLGWYPIELLNEFCRDLVWKDEFVKDQNNDIARECRHSFGHAFYYILAKAEHPELNISLTNTLRPASNFTLSDDIICKVERICISAPNIRTRNECRGGFRHSYKLYSAYTEGMEEALVERHAKCRQTNEYKLWMKELWGARNIPK